uniref:Uncharacterized protein n=1 Tax=Strigamia maritima TaxID=126957 RepID=T1JAM4_STRMM
MSLQNLYQIIGLFRTWNFPNAVLVVLIIAKLIIKTHSKSCGQEKAPVRELVLPDPSGQLLINIRLFLSNVTRSHNSYTPPNTINKLTQNKVEEHRATSVRFSSTVNSKCLENLKNLPKNLKPKSTLARLYSGQNNPHE